MNNELTLKGYRISEDYLKPRTVPEELSFIHAYIYEHFQEIELYKADRWDEEIDLAIRQLWKVPEERLKEIYSDMPMEVNKLLKRIYGDNCCDTNCDMDSGCDC